MTAMADPPRNAYERVQRTNEVLAPFRPRPFRWDRKATCIHVGRAQLAAFGHAVPLVPNFRTPIGARRALHKMGHRDLRGLLGTYVPEIPAAKAWVGDIVLLPGQVFEALFVYAGNGSLIGWHEDAADDRMTSVTDSLGHAIAAFRL